MLQQFPDTRNSDELLYLVVCKAICPRSAHITFEKMTLEREAMGLPKFITVDRARRKIQAANPDLRASKDVEDKRFENYKAYKEYALED